MTSHLFIKLMTVIVAVRRIAALHEIPRNARFHQAMMVLEGFARRLKRVLDNVFKTDVRPFVDALNAI
ncbi:hypothetical protein ABIB85_005132 [Bradyrhizobium sp. JR1.5]|uniref:hypothetical protein n=1 Tax=unclassified Bradyrhizobium TaxID=2631580 RepID=UPI0033914112